MAQKKKDAGTTPPRRSLREYAEEQLAQFAKTSPATTGQTAEALIHELQVHQIELEIQAEELRNSKIALEESRDTYLDLYDFAPLGYFTISDKARINGANLTGAKLLGVERSRLVNAQFSKFVAEKDADEWHWYFMNVLNQKEKRTCTLMLKRGDGSMFPARLEAVLITGSDRVNTVRVAVSDITDIRLAEERAGANLTKYQVLFESVPLGITVSDKAGNIVESNRMAEHLLGLPKKEQVGRQIDGREWRIIRPDGSLMPEDEFASVRALQENRLVANIEMGIVKGEEDITWINVTAAPVPLEGYGVAIAYSDITTRKAAEEALQLTLSRLESAMEAGSIAWWEMDCTTGNVSFSERKARMLGYPAEQFSHYTDFTTLLHPDDAEPAMQEMRDHLSGLKKQYDVEYRIRTRNSGYRWFHDIGKISEYTPDGKPLKVTGLVIDITERKRAEAAQVETTRKLNVLSNLTRKDLTSQIFVLNGYLNLAKKHEDDKDQVIKTLSKGDDALRSIREIIEYTKDYEDMGIKPTTWQNVNLVLLFGLSHVSIGEIQHSFETGNLEIFADPLLEKVCQRLFENSLAHGGHVTHIRVWHKKTPDGITILFEDDGVGISAEKKEQIFLRSEDTTRFSMRSLIFVREILDITGITIRETGEPGKGARYEMAVPEGTWRTTGNGA